MPSATGMENTIVGPIIDPRINPEYSHAATSPPASSLARKKPPISHASSVPANIDPRRPSRCWCVRDCRHGAGRSRHLSITSRQIRSSYDRILPRRRLPPGCFPGPAYRRHDERRCGDKASYFSRLRSNRRQEMQLLRLLRRHSPLLIALHKGLRRRKVVLNPCLLKA